MLLDPPAELLAELTTRWTAYRQAEANYQANPTTLNQAILNTALKGLNKTLDKCSIELGLPTTPRPTVQEQQDGTLKLLYPAP